MEKLEIISLKELCERITEIVVGSNYTQVLKCDFTDRFTDNEDLQNSKETASAWYGIDRLKTRLDSEGLILAVDYFGGGSLKLGVVQNGTDKETVACTVMALIQTAWDRLISPEDRLLVDFSATETEKSVIECDTLDCAFHNGEGCCYHLIHGQPAVDDSGCHSYVCNI